MNNPPSVSATSEFLILPEDATNELFTLNLEAIKRYFPTSLFPRIRHHHCKKYKICLNPDESMNILNMASNTPLYPLSQQAMEQYFEQLAATIQINLKKCIDFLAHDDESRQMVREHPLHAQLYSNIYEIGGFAIQDGQVASESIIKTYQINFLPLLKIYGTGLGLHIVKTLERHDIACLIIHEPEMDLFFNSLFSIPWYQILPMFIDAPDRDCLLCIGNDAETALAEIKKFLEHRHPYYTHADAVLYGHFENDFTTLSDAVDKFEYMNHLNSTSGWYEDQVVGLTNSVRNMVKKNRFYHGSKQRLSHPVFLVGSGPSLNTSIAFLNKHQHEAIIIACGSALTVLVKNDIVPDFHILQERTWDKAFTKDYAPEALFKQLTLLKLNVVDTSLDELYQEVLIFQKARDPGSCLLDPLKYPISTAVNPTVTNAGISFSISFGAQNIYLFGIDYGAPADHEFLHAKDTIVVDDDRVHTDSEYILPGINTSQIISNEILSWSHKTSEDTIMQHPEINWINVGEGALIQNTRNETTETLSRNFKGSPNKAAAISVIKQCFDDNYSVPHITAELQQRHLHEAMDYLNAILDCFDTTPSTRRGIMKNIEIISKAASIGADEDQYMPQKLFGCETLRYLNLVYTQVVITSNDQQAVDFYIKSIDIFRRHAESIFSDLQNKLHLMPGINQN